MAKKLLLPESYQKNADVSPTAKWVINGLLDEAAYGESGSVEVRALCSELGLKGQDVQEAVTELSLAKWLRICQGETHVLPHEATGYMLRVELIATPVKLVDPITGQQQMSFGDGPVSVDKRAIGRDFFIAEHDSGTATRHDWHVERVTADGGDGTLCYQANITVRDIGSEEEVRPFQDLQFANEDLAWDFWEAYHHDHDPLARARAMEFDVRAWAISVIDQDCAELLLSPKAFGALRTALLGLGDDFDTGDSFDWRVIEQDYTYSVVCELDGHRLPDGDAPDVTDEPDGLTESDADHTWTFGVTDEVEVKCRAVAKGRGAYALTFEGPVSEGGTVTETAKKKQYGEDLEGWCSVRASELHQAYMKATGGAVGD